MKRLAMVLFLVVSVAWTAGNAVVAMSAAMMFRDLSDDVARLNVGTLFGKALSLWSTVIDVSLWPLSVLLLVSFAFANRGRRVLFFAVLLLLAATALTHGLARNAAHQTNSLLAERRQHDSDDLRLAFGKMHERTRKLIEAETMIALLTAIGAGVALARRPRPGV